MKKFDASKINSAFKNCAFHFRHHSLKDEVENNGIVSKNGLQSQHGNLNNREKFSKICLGVGFDGGLRVLNRFLNISFDKGVSLNTLQSVFSHYANFSEESFSIPQNQNKVDLSDLPSDYMFSLKNPEDVERIFNILEKFFEDRLYYIIPYFNPMKYDQPSRISSKPMENIIQDINSSSEITAIRNELLAAQTFEEKVKLAAVLRKKSIELLDIYRGKKIENSGMYEPIDFDDAKLEIRMQRAHNVHTEMIPDGDIFVGKDIKPEQICELNINGKNANALQVLQTFAQNIPNNYALDPITKKAEFPLVEFFSQYTSIPKENIEARKKIAENVSIQYRKEKENSDKEHSFDEK